MGKTLNHSAVPGLRELLAIGLFAVALRGLVFAGAMGFGHLSLARYAAKGDTSGYMAVASAMSEERSIHSLDEYDRRVFPGYPALIAIVHLFRVPLPVAALGVTWVCAGIGAAGAGKIFNDARVGWAMTCLIPHYLVNSSLGMSEAPVLAGICLGVILLQSDRIIWSGILLGMAGLIRPMACFAVAGAIWALWREEKKRGAVWLAVGAAGTFAAGIIALQYWTGDALLGVRVYANDPAAYAGHIVAWPFYSLLVGTESASIGRIIYIWLHVVVTLLAVGLVSYRGMRKKEADERDLISFPWLLGNTAMVLCIGPPWGFMHFPRFTIPASPAMMWTLRRALPRDWRIWMVIAGGCLVFGVIGVISSP